MGYGLVVGLPNILHIVIGIGVIPFVERAVHVAEAADRIHVIALKVAGDDERSGEVAAEQRIGSELEFLEIAHRLQRLIVHQLVLGIGIQITRGEDHRADGNYDRYCYFFHIRHLY